MSSILGCTQKLQLKHAYLLTFVEPSLHTTACSQVSIDMHCINAIVVTRSLHHGTSGMQMLLHKERPAF